MHLFCMTLTAAILLGVHNRSEKGGQKVLTRDYQTLKERASKESYRKKGRGQKRNSSIVSLPLLSHKAIEKQNSRIAKENENSHGG